MRNKLGQQKNSGGICELTLEQKQRVWNRFFMGINTLDMRTIPTYSDDIPMKVTFHSWYCQIVVYIYDRFDYPFVQTIE